jgi:hypothetical protein
LKDKTPKEAFTGKAPKVSHLHVFGCLVYIHVPNEKRTTLEPSSIKDIFVGYSKTSKAYQIYIPTQRKSMVNRYVHFEEDGWSLKSQQPSIEIGEGEKLVVLKSDMELKENRIQISKVVPIKEQRPHYPRVQPRSRGGLFIYYRMYRSKWECQSLLFG